MRRILFFLLRNALLASAAALSRGWLRASATRVARGRLAERVTFVTSCPVNDDRGSSPLIRRRPNAYPRATRSLRRLQVIFPPVPPRRGEKRLRPRGAEQPPAPTAAATTPSRRGIYGIRVERRHQVRTCVCWDARARTVTNADLRCNGGVPPSGPSGSSGSSPRERSRVPREQSLLLAAPDYRIPYENRLGGSCLRFPALSQPRLSSAPLYLYDPF